MAGVQVFGLDRLQDISAYNVSQNVRGSIRLARAVFLPSRVVSRDPKITRGQSRLMHWVQRIDRHLALSHMYPPFLKALQCRPIEHEETMASTLLSLMVYGCP